ncbi:GNAT family protein [Pseudarthrobacter sp. PS3-L1]|uniref:GNAT family N-acetyltransferase n=1 Tax=Pseudarthrobacter sp. PS3-L1 TaxID=3046207 RepID=UPI0024BA689E|nr:GNAT family protein [Pseudarthrobacter sp. PS3-L1]MDJ0319050.1 GNAT family protein [Pseudarthrobacter sp. PS3-L1]
MLEHLAKGHTIAPGVSIRTLVQNDADELAAALKRNREHLAPWDPLRTDAFFTATHQRRIIAAKELLLISGQEVPLVMTDDAGAVVGALTLSGIVRGPFLSANLGYWVDYGHTGKGLCAAAVEFTLRTCRGMGLHRVQASTLLHNHASRAVLRKTGFTEIGVAPTYRRIAGTWQDHVLHQRILD